MPKLQAVTLPLSIVLAGALVGAALAICLRFQIAPGPLGAQYSMLLDRWSGDVVICMPNAAAALLPQPGFRVECGSR